jgi:hypothetical protein
LEIFAVAAVGFVLKHDVQFKKNFLKKFADIEESVENFEPSIQAADCADLKLENSSKRILVVVEFKVGAELQPKQNPWPDTRKSDDDSLPFWSKDESGYGNQYGNKSNFNQFSTVYYIVVQQNGTPRNEMPCKKFGKSFYLKSRSWKSLLEPDPGLEDDLVKSLAELGIEELEDWRMKGIKIENGDLEALFKGKTAVELILHISTKLGWRKDVARNRLTGFFTEGSCGNVRQLGLYAPKEALKRLAGIRANFLKDAWYGYFSENNQPFKAEVWFYCNENAQPELRALVEKELNSALIQENPDEKGLRIIRNDNEALGDSEWFCKALGI